MGDHLDFAIGVIGAAGKKVSREELSEWPEATVQHALVWADSVQSGTPIDPPEAIRKLDVFMERFASIECIADEFAVSRSYGKDPPTDDEQEIIDELKDAEILIAWYGYGSYCGDADVLYRKNGELWRNVGGHCSCNGLEGQWSPTVTTWKTLAMEFANKEPSEYDGHAEYINAMKALIASNTCDSDQRTPKENE